MPVPAQMLLPTRGVNRSQVQNDCATHYRSIADEFTRQGKIKACMRATWGFVIIV